MVSKLRQQQRVNKLVSLVILGKDFIQLQWSTQGRPPLSTRASDPCRWNQVEVRGEL